VPRLVRGLREAVILPVGGTGHQSLLLRIGRLWGTILLAAGDPVLESLIAAGNENAHAASIFCTSGGLAFRRRIPSPPALIDEA
jgi:hypothetical protein